MSRRRKVDIPPEEGAPAWMTTYGDMVTLVLTFFVLLFAMSTIDTKKWEAIAMSFSGNRIVAIEPLDPDLASKQLTEMVITPRPVSRPANNQDENVEQFNELFERIQSYIEDNGLDYQLGVSLSDNVIVLRVKDSALFDSGSSDIRSDAIEILNRVADLFDEYSDNLSGIKIEGHTDNVPIHTAKYNSNWELSVARASSVVQFLLRNTVIPPAKYELAGYGEYHPIAGNDTEDGKAKNRRVDFVITGIQNEG